MEQIKLNDVDHDLEDIDLAKEYPIDDQDVVYFNEHSANKKTTSSRDDVNEDNFDDDEEDVYKRQILLAPASMEMAMPMAGLPS